MFQPLQRQENLPRPQPPSLQNCRLYLATIEENELYPTLVTDTHTSLLLIGITDKVTRPRGATTHMMERITTQQLVVSFCLMLTSMTSTYPFLAPSQYASNYLSPAHHPHFAYNPYIEPPEPIIEIIIKDSNETLSRPPAPQPLIRKKKKEKVHVYYVKYKKGEDNKLHLDEPIASLNNDEENYEEEEEEIVQYPVVTPLPPVKATTLRTVIHPDSEKFHSSNRNVHVTFGSEDKSKIGHRIEEHNAESIRQSVVAVPVKSSYQKPQGNYVEPPRFQLLPQLRSRSSFQIPSGPPAPPRTNHEHYQQLPQQTLASFRPPPPPPPQQQYHQQNYQSQSLPQSPSQFNAKPLFASSFYQPQQQREHQSQAQRQNVFFPTAPPSTQLLPYQNSGPQYQQQFLRPGPPATQPPQHYQQPQEPSVHHQPQPIPLNTEVVPPKPQQQQYVPPSPPLLPQYHQISQQSQQQHFETQQKQQHQTEQQHQAQQEHRHQQQHQAQQEHRHQQQHQAQQEQQYQSHQQKQQSAPQHHQEPIHHQQQQFNYQPHQYQHYQPGYQESKPLPVQPLQKETYNQYNNHPASDALTALHSKFNIQPSRQTELLKAIPKYEQHITETININPGFERTHTQTINAASTNYSRPTGHFITTGRPQQQQELTNYVTSPRSAYVPQQSSPAPQYVHSENGEQVQIVTPMPSTSIYNLEQQQRLLTGGKQPVIIPNSQPRPGFSSPYSVSTLYSDAFQELEQKKQKHSESKSQLPNYVQIQSRHPSGPSASSGPSAPAKPNIELPDEVPDDLRQQLLSSGILNNADISILDYDKVGDIALENLPQEHLQHFYGAGGGAQISESNKVLTVVKPNGDSVNISEKEVEAIKETRVLPKKNVELKVVKYDSNSKKTITDKYIKDDATILPTVDLSSEKLYNKYLPVKVNGAQFPIPDVEELRGKTISNVVVLAPVDTSSESNESRQERDVSKSLKLNDAGDNLKALVKKPTRENFKKWLDSESKQDVEQQSVVLLVSK